MVDDRVLAILRCPNDHSTLRPVETELLERLNEEIRQGRVRNQSGVRIERPLGGGLVRAGGDLLYPIVDRIPVMLYDEAIPLNQLSTWGE
jgi:uncharacterized protein YbaR (Trm112 family)